MMRFKKKYLKTTEPLFICMYVCTYFPIASGNVLRVPKLPKVFFFYSCPLMDFLHLRNIRAAKK